MVKARAVVIAGKFHAHHVRAEQLISAFHGLAGARGCFLVNHGLLLHQLRIAGREQQVASGSHSELPGAAKFHLILLASAPRAQHQVVFQRFDEP